MTRISRRFNYTHRVRIPASRIHVEVERGEDGKHRGMVKRLDLSDHGRHTEALWKSANVVVEARRVSMGLYKKQVLGTVARNHLSNSIEPIDLSEFPDETEIVFRFKVVDPEKKLLGEVDGVKSGERKETDRDPLIYLVPTDLKEELWKVDHTDEAIAPQVLVNKRLPNASGLLTKDPLVRGLILPQIVRQVLAIVATSEQQSEPWMANWISFAAKYGHVDLPDPEDPDAVRKWVDIVVESFTDELKLATLAERQLHAGDEA